MNRVPAACDLVPGVCVGAAMLAALVSDTGVSGGGLSGFGLVPWAVGLLIFGLPHGACDHLLAARLSGRRGTRYAVAFFVLYLALAAPMLVLWVITPEVALVLFLGLTVWHWGSADESFRLENGLAWFVTASAGRGLLVICAPVALHPQESRVAFDELASTLLSGGASPGWLPMLATGGLLLALALTVAVTAADLTTSSKTKDKAGRRMLREAVEVALLLGLFYLVSPVAAVGLYFVFWHAFRHVLRVGSGFSKGGPLRVVLAYHAGALPLTLVSLAALSVLFLATDPSRPAELFGPALILISALTVPHAALVLIWDARTARHLSRH